MSHFTMVKTKIKDLEILDVAAKQLGLRRKESTTVSGYAHRTTAADAVWQVDDRYDVGAVKNADGTYSLVADWWGTSYTVPNLSGRLVQEYAVQKVLRRAKLLGHQVAREQQKDGSVRLVVKTS